MAEFETVFFNVYVLLKQIRNLIIYLQEKRRKKKSLLVGETYFQGMGKKYEGPCMLKFQ